MGEIARRARRGPNGLALPFSLFWTTCCHERRTLLGRAERGTCPTDALGTWHHIGTTRMHDDPKKGVVDESCAVHGIDNLYIAGSSVFPTGGATSPTLTLIALSLRLADHIAHKLSR